MRNRLGAGEVVVGASSIFPAKRLVESTSGGGRSWSALRPRDSTVKLRFAAPHRSQHVPMGGLSVLCTW